MEPIFCTCIAHEKWEVMILYSGLSGSVVDIKNRQNILSNSSAVEKERCEWQIDVLELPFLPRLKGDRNNFSTKFCTRRKIRVFWGVTLGHWARDSRCFEDEGTAILQNSGSCSPSDTGSHPRRLWNWKLSLSRLPVWHCARKACVTHRLWRELINTLTED